MSFRAKVEKRIEELCSFEKTIARINELNELILKALRERSMYPVCRSYFENVPQRALESQGIDTVWWDPVYSKIVEKICEEGEIGTDIRHLAEELEDGTDLEAIYHDRRDMVQAESRLEELVYERIMIGRKVIEYKSPRGLAITRKDREEEVIKNVREGALDYSLDPDVVEDIFRFLMQKNKDVQEVLEKKDLQEDEDKKDPYSHLTVVRTCKTMQAKPYEPGDGDSVDKARGMLQSEGDRLAEETGIKHYTVVSTPKEEKEWVLPIYEVKLVRE